MSGILRSRLEAPQISIVTVCYNAAGSIERCLGSVQMQKGVSFEHIIIDGASVDGTQSVVSKIRSRTDNVVFLSEPDCGIYDAMNKGLSLAKGEYIAILNSDDYYSFDYVLSEIVSTFREHEGLDAILTDIEFVDTNGALKRKVRAKWFQPHRLAYGWMPPHPGMFLSSRVYQTYGLFRDDMEIASDYEYCVRIFGKGKATYLKKPFTSVYMQEGGVSTRGWKSNWIITREIIRACQLNDFPCNFLLLAARLPIKALMSFAARFRE